MKIKRLLFFLLLLSCFMAVDAAVKQKYTLVIDAGHGGKDAGACAFSAKEKNINLNVALAFGRYVERNCPDVRVIYTRKTDVFIPLHERASIANRNKADVFISIHTNAVASKRPIVGMETYTMGMRRSDEKLSAAMRENEVVLIEKDYKQHYAGYDPRSPESMMVFQIMNEQNMAKSVELASMIQKYTCSTASRPNKGVRQDAFLVLRETSMPACLIELGYITTRSDMTYLTNSKNVELMGKGIYQAFVAFKNKQQGKAAPAVQERPVAETPVQPAIETPAQPVVEKPVKPVAETPAQTVVETPQQPVADAPQQNNVQSEVGGTVAAQTSLGSDNWAKPIFVVQLFVSDVKLKNTDSRLKGLKNVHAFKEGGMWKYATGASEDYNKVYQTRKQLLKKYPKAFIIAFRNGEKMDAGKAYQEFKRSRGK